MLGSVLVRCDAGPTVGVGHAMRCLALAEELVARGCAVHLMAGPLPPWVEQRYQALGVPFRTADPGVADPHRSAHAAEAVHADAVVLDGYPFDAAFQNVAAFTVPVLAFDDLGGPGPFPPPIVVNQNLYAAEAMYPAPRSGQRFLLGPRYVCVRDEVRGAAAARRPPDDRWQVLVASGGAAADTVAARFEGVAEVAGRPVCVDPIRPGAPGPGLVERAAQSHLVVTAGGSTCWELLALGVPMLVYTAASNQVHVGPELARRGLAHDLGPLEALTAAAARDAVRSALEDESWLADAGRQGPSIVDGAGRERVVDALEHTVVETPA